MKKKYICPTTKLLKMDVGFGIMTGSDGRNTANNGPQGSVDTETLPPPGGSTAKGYNAWEAWDEF
mgnify:FL=1